MRTTVRLNDSVARQAKHYAAEHGLTFTALIEESLRTRISSAAVSRPAPALELPSFRGNGVRPGVDLDDSARLLDTMEAR